MLKWFSSSENTYIEFTHLMLYHRLRRWPNVITTVGRRLVFVYENPANTKYLYNICTTSAQLLRRWPNIAQMFCVFWEISSTLMLVCARVIHISGFVKLKKFQKSEKNSEVGGWVKPQLGFLFFLILCFFVFFFSL